MPLDLDEDNENDFSLLKQSIDSQDCIPNPPAEDPFEDVMKCIYGHEVLPEGHQDLDDDDSDYAQIAESPSKTTNKQVQKLSVKTISKQKGSLKSEKSGSLRDGLRRRDSISIKQKTGYSPLLKSIPGRPKLENPTKRH